VALKVQLVLVACVPQLSVAVLQVGANEVKVSPLQLGAGAVHVVTVCVGVPHALPEAQVGVNVVKLPALQVVAWVGQAASVGAPGLKHPLAVVLHAAVKVRRVGTLEAGTQIGAPAVHAAVEGFTAQPPGSAQVGVRVVS
jgi:hypothetical protein